MDKFLHSRLFRCMVCLILICCILFNCSPVRAEASAATAGFSAFAVFLWFMMMYGGVVIEPTQQVLEDLDRAGQAVIDDWMVQAAVDVEGASEELREAMANLEEWIMEPDNFTGESPENPEDSNDPNWGLGFDNNGNIVMGVSLGAALADLIYDFVTDGKVDVEQEVVEGTAPEGKMYYGDSALIEFTQGNIYDGNFNLWTGDLGDYPYWCLVQHAGYYTMVISPSCPDIWYEPNSYLHFPDGYLYFHAYSTYWLLSGSGGNDSSTSFSLIWSNEDIYCKDELFYSGSAPSPTKTSTQTTTVTPSTYFGDVPSQIQAGTFNPSSFQYPSKIDLNEMVSSKESALSEMQNLYNQIVNNNYTYNQYVEQITYKDSVVDPGGSEVSPNPDPSPSDPSEESSPDEEDPDDPSIYNIDLTDFFPFCIPYDIYEIFQIIVAPPEAPKFHWELEDLEGNVYEIDVDLSPWDPLAAFFRDLELLLFIFGLMWVTRDLIKW